MKSPVIVGTRGQKLEGKVSVHRTKISNNRWRRNDTVKKIVRVVKEHPELLPVGQT